MKCDFCLQEATGPICIACLKLASEGKLLHRDSCPWISRKGSCTCDGKEKKVADPKGMRINFGKYKGELIENLETSYIEWCLENYEGLKGEMRKEFENQLELRKGRGVVRK